MLGAQLIHGLGGLQLHEKKLLVIVRFVTIHFVTIRFETQNHFVIMCLIT
jgi:hypothetical protein